MQVLKLTKRYVVAFFLLIAVMFFAVDSMATNVVSSCTPWPSFGQSCMDPYRKWVGGGQKSSFFHPGEQVSLLEGYLVHPEVATFQDWIMLSQAGSSPYVLGPWMYAALSYWGGIYSLPTTSTATPRGNYVIRVFLNGTFNIEFESKEFRISPADIWLSTESTICTSALTTINLASLTGNYYDWVAVAPVNSPATTYIGSSWIYTWGKVNGTTVLYMPSNPGTYVLRAYVNNTYEIDWESPPFTVNSCN